MCLNYDAQDDLLLVARLPLSLLPAAESTSTDEFTVLKVRPGEEAVASPFAALWNAAICNLGSKFTSNDSNSGDISHSLNNSVGTDPSDGTTPVVIPFQPTAPRRPDSANKNSSNSTASVVAPSQIQSRPGRTLRAAAV